METLFDIITVFVIFFVVNYSAYYMTEVKTMPQWLQYKPWNCKLCLTFWSLVVSYLTVGLIFNLPITLYGGIALAILNALAMWIDQKNKTIKI